MVTYKYFVQKYKKYLVNSRKISNFAPAIHEKGVLLTRKYQ